MKCVVICGSTLHAPQLGSCRRMLVRWVRVQISERRPDAWRDVHDDKPAMKPTGMRQSAGVRDHLEVAFEGQRVVADSHALVRGVQPGLKPPILRRHTGRAGVGVAAQRLDATDRKEEAAPDVNQVRAAPA